MNVHRFFKCLLKLVEYSLEMLKRQKKILKIVAILFILVLGSTFVTHYLSPSLTSNYIDEKWFKQEIAITDNPWSKKRWQRLKLITDSVNELQIRKTILLWTKFFGATDYVPKLADMCPVPKCHITSNRNYLNKSDAIIFHLRDLSLKDMPHFRIPNQIWILLHHESPPHTPDVLYQLNGLFNWTATYRFDSEILLTPLVIKKQHSTDLQQINYSKSKVKMIAWFVSNCKTPSNRESFVKELQKSIPLDIYGSCGTLTCLPKMSDECYAKIGDKYRFYLAFENSICKDYVTEKFFHVLNTNMVPIVLGGANYSSVAPPNSYIDALSFKSPKELAKYLLQVANDEILYNSFFEWKKDYEIIKKHYACNICKILHQPVLQPSLYANISHWWFGVANCKSWPF